MLEARGHPHNLSHLRNWERTHNHNSGICQIMKLLPPPLFHVLEVGGWTLASCFMETGFSQHCNIQEPQEDGLCLTSLLNTCGKHIIEKISLATRKCLVNVFISDLSRKVNWRLTKYRIRSSPSFVVVPLYASTSKKDTCFLILSNNI